jgi:release factor glutamine methyltransferase
MAAGIDNARREALLLLALATGEEPARLGLEPDRRIDEAKTHVFENLLTRRANHEPFSRLAGEREFWSLDFTIDPAVLDPRADSETLVEAALARMPDIDGDYRVLDFGAGSGCLLLSVLSERPRSRGVGVDISARALAVASTNAIRHGLAARTGFVCADWGAGLSGRYDIILCNPPYISVAEMGALAPEVADHDPHMALVGGEDGLSCYRAIAPHIARLLAENGCALVECGAGQAAEIQAVFARSGLCAGEVVKDLAGVPRCAIFNL